MLDVLKEKIRMEMESETAGPRTPAGRQLFTDMDPGDMMESNGVTWGDIEAVEREAVALALTELLVAARELRDADSTSNDERYDLGWYDGIGATLALIDRAVPR